MLHKNQRKFDKKEIKIGYFGLNLQSSSIKSNERYFINHDKSKFEIYGFYHGPVKDTYIMRLDISPIF